MKSMYRLLAISVMSLGFSALPLLSHAATPSVFISEVGWAGSTQSASDEFLELYNASSQTISLANWSLHGAATGGEALSLPEEAVIAPGATYLIANYAPDHGNSALTVAPDFTTSRLALPNTNLSIALVDHAGTVHDRAGDGIGSPPAGSSGVSMVRTDASTRGNTDDAWVEAVTSVGFKTNLLDQGTPGTHTTGTQIVAPDPEETPPEATTSPAPATQVHPIAGGTDPNVITVIHQGFVFELNLPPQEVSPSQNDATETSPTTPTTTSVQTTETSSSLSTAASPQASGEVSVETPAAMSLQTLRFSEIYANAIGSDEEEEYIEIENFGDATLDLLGWSIRDASGKTWTADGNFAIGADRVVALPRTLTKIALNNTGETLELIHPSGQITDIVSYEKAAKGSTYTRTGDTWSWQHPTPNTIEAATTTSPSSTEDQLVIPDVTVSSPEEPSETTNTGNPPEDTSNTSHASGGFTPMTITQARNAAFDRSVRVEGVVVSTPGTFASQSFYLQNDAGIQVYMYAADFPTLSVGDRIGVQGVTSQNRGESRVKLSGPEAIHYLGSESVSPSSVDLSIVGEAFESQLITVEALVESARSDEMILVDGASQLQVLARDRTDVSFATISSGSTVRVTGIVSESNGTYRLLPRMQSDLHIVELAPEGDDSLLGGAGTTGSEPPTGIYGGILLLSSLGLLGFWYLRSRKSDDLTLTNI